MLGHRRLVTDVMLAKLARWMRLLGISVESAPYVNDERILRYVKRTKSILLTSDKALYRRALKAGAGSLLVQGDSLAAQLKLVFGALGLAPDTNREICTLCNSPLRKISPESATRHRVPKRIVERYNEFYYCGRCKKVYWRGTHMKRVMKVASLLKAHRRH